MSNSSSTKNKIITKSTQKRLLRDVVDVLKNPLSDQGIYYIHDEENILSGYAMIIGPGDTPYENGIYMFNFHFPSNYPFSPPTLKYLTNDGSTRFNPNLYRSGKVCISILNTWKGEQWTSCQTIRSVLLTLVTVLNETPLINEPGISKNHSDVKRYNQYIKYKNYEVAMCNVLSKKCLPNKHVSFYPIIKNHFKEKKDIILKNLAFDKEKYEKKTNKLSENDKYYKTRIYNMSCLPCYESLEQKMTNLFNNILN